MVAAVLMVALLQVSSQPAAPQGTPPRDERLATKGTGVIRGRVVAADTGTPIRGCNVMLVTARPEIRDETGPWGIPDDHRSARTNEDGRFEFDGLPEGTYRLSAWPDPANGRYVAPSGGIPGFSLGKVLNLANDQKLEAPDIRLTRAGVLSGRVVDEFGEPVAHVQVSPLRRSGARDPVSGHPSSTDDYGRFRLFGLQPGEYLVIAKPLDYFRVRAEGPVRPLPTYLPSAATLADAAAVRVQAGQEIGDLEIRLLSGRTYKISGVITTSKGQPFSTQNGQVSFVERTGDGGLSGNSVALRESGTFEVDGVRSGTYWLEIQPGFSHPNEDAPTDAEYASVPVVVAGDDVEGLTVVTQPGVSMAGEVVFDGPFPEDLQPLDVTGVPANQVTMMHPPSRARVDPNGAFVLKGLYRPVYIRVAAPRGHHLASVAFEGHDITDTPTEFKAGTTGKLLVTLSRRASALSGEVHNSNGPASSFVIVFGEDRALWTSLATTTKGGHTGEEGKYWLGGLRPGRYLVAALPTISGLRFLNGGTPEEWESLAKQATPVTIGDNERKVLNLKVVSELDR
jgi:Carboxypeptidase regulatory-like domain